MRNAGQYPADAPLIVGVKNISDPTVRAVGFDGVMPDGTPYFDFTQLMAGKTLAPGGTTDYQSLSFLDPNRSQFTYDLVFLGKLNQAPAITSVPVVDAIAGRSYYLRGHRDRSRQRPADLLAHDRPARPCRSTPPRARSPGARPPTTSAPTTSPSASTTAAAATPRRPT